MMHGASGGGPDLSPWSMFLDADPVVQAVMVGLVLASVAVWTVLVAKSLELYEAKSAATRAATTLRQALAIPAAAEAAGIAATLLAAVRAELDASRSLADRVGGKERIASLLQEGVAAEARRMTRGMGMLATIGATAPFVGLFGTVWGIMNSFIGISAAQATSLAVVAPGIAEALLATALGLIAAIPAVAIYNHLTRAIGGYRALVAETAATIERLASREMHASSWQGFPSRLTGT